MESQPSLLSELGQAKERADEHSPFCQDPELLELAPTLFEILNSRQNAGEWRDPGKMTIFCDQGAWKVCVSLPSEGVVAFVTLPSLCALVSTLERALKARSLDWRPDKKSARKGSPPPK